MTFASPTLELPTATTHSSYTIVRVGDPLLTIGCTGTVLSTIDFTVTAVTASIEGGALDTVALTPVITPGPARAAPSLSGFTGWRVLLAGATLGTVDSTPATNTLKLVVTGTLTAEAVGQVLSVARRNGFGNEMQRPAIGGTTWSRTLSSTDPTHLAYMERALGSVFINAIYQGCQQLGLSVVLSDIQQAVMELATQASPVTIEDLISDQLVLIEQACQAKELVCPTMGVAPVA